MTRTQGAWPVRVDGKTVQHVTPGGWQHDGPEAQCAQCFTRKARHLQRRIRATLDRPPTR